MHTTRMILFSKVDPYFYIANFVLHDFHIFEHYPLVCNFAYCLRILLVFSNSFHITRAICLSYLLFIHFFKKLSLIGIVLNNSLGEFDYVKVLKIARIDACTLLLLSVSTTFTSICVTLGITSVAIICVLFNFIILMGFNRALFLFYVYAATANFLGYFIVCFTLPATIQIYENSFALKKRLAEILMNRRLSYLQKRFLTRKIKSLKTWSIEASCGTCTFFIILRSIMSF